MRDIFSLNLMYDIKVNENRLDVALKRQRLADWLKIQVSVFKRQTFLDMFLPPQRTKILWQDLLLSKQI